MTRPSAKDINPFGDLDGDVAERNFLGKSVDDAVELFRENSTRYQEDLLWMGPVAFAYYLPAATAYLATAEAAGDDLFVDWLRSTFEHRLKHDGDALEPARDAMRAFARAVLADWERFEVEEFGAREAWQRLVVTLGGTPD